MPLSAELSQEIASSQNDPYHHLFNDIPWSPDDTLLYLLGGDTDYYDLISKDAKAKGLLETRDRNVQLRDYKVEPASGSAIDKKAADAVRDILKGCDFDELTSDLNNNAWLKGNSFIEIIWEINGKTTYIKDAICRPVHRFKFHTPLGKFKNPVGMYRNHEIRVLSTNDLQEGSPVPPKRILCHAYGKKDDNPWGIGLGRVLYWLCVTFKKEIIKQRLIFLDKYAQPTALAKAPKTATKEQRQEFNQLMSRFIKGGYGTLPDGWEVSFLEAQRNSTNDLFQSFIDWCNAEMAMCVLGETLSMELPKGTGSRAATESHQEGSGLYLAKFDCDRLSSGPYRELAAWITELNYPDANPPMIWKLFPELEDSEDLNARVNRDNALNTIGYKINSDKVKEVYGEGYADNAAIESETQNHLEDSGAFDVGFKEGSYAERKAIAFKERLNRWR